MKTVGLGWTPSVSAGVDGQFVRIFDVDSLTVYGEAAVEITATQFTTQVPEGVTVQGAVVTTRGEQEATALSNTLEVGYGPLEPATGLTLELAFTTQR